MHLITRVIFSVLLLISSINSAMADGGDRELVVLLHGIGHAEWNMAGIEYALQKAGYQTLNVGYPSREKSLADLSGFLDAKLKKEGVWDSSYYKIHFATHSMGGLVVRTYLSAYKSEIVRKKLGRVIMLAPPHGGSEVADLLKNFPLYQWVFGPAGQELTTKQQIKMQADVYYDLGIIAGDKKWPYIIAAHIIPDKSDGRVGVEKTKLKGMKDHVTLSATHSFISWKPSVYRQIVYFLKYGKFKRAANSFKN